VSFRNEKDDGALLDIHLVDGAVQVQLRQDRGTAYPDEIKSPSLVQAGEWHHLAVTRSVAGEIELFVDGAFVGKKQGTASNGNITTNWRCLGFEKYWEKAKTHTPEHRRFQGGVDEFCVFNRVLGAAEIAELAGRQR
jgi:hypothetical protein